MDQKTKKKQFAEILEVRAEALSRSTNFHPTTTAN